MRDQVISMLTALGVTGATTDPLLDILLQTVQQRILNKTNQSVIPEGLESVAVYNLLKRYKDTGEDVYFDIQVTNEDPTSSVGRQTVILKDCNMDGGLLAKFDADAEYLDEDMDFTFEDFEMPETFTMLAGME